MNPHPLEPIASFAGMMPAGASLSGFSRFGGFESILWTEGEFGWICAFSVIPVDRELTGLAVFFFIDGSYHARVGAGVGFFEFLPPPVQAETEVVAAVFPNHSDFESFPVVDLRRFSRLDLDWTYSGEAERAGVRWQAGASVTTTLPRKLFRYPVPTVTDETAASGGTLSADGYFLGPENSGTITVAVTTGGKPGQGAVISWSFAGSSGSAPMPIGRRLLIDGIKVTFEADHTYEVGDEWEITLDLPKTFTTPPLEVGQWSAEVDLYNRRLATSSSNTVSKTVAGPPDPPTFVSATYNGGGECEVTFTIPTDGAIVKAHFYLNFSALCISSQSATGDGSNQAFTIEGLRTGELNQVLCRLANSDGEESQNVDWQEVLVDSGDNQVASRPNPPYDIRVTEGAGGILSVAVDADDSSTSIELFRDDQDGVIDYSTAIGTISNPQSSYYQTLTGTIDWNSIGAGRFSIGARAKVGTYTEQNTDVYTEIFVEIAAAPTPVLTGALAR